MSLFTRKSSALRIACVHQGYELYGSDRCFAESVAVLRAAYPDAEIEVVLPKPGPITSLLEKSATRMTFEPLWVLRRRSLLFLATVGLARFPAALLRAARRFAANDLVYINTAVVSDHILVARLFPGKALLHIHEIPEPPASVLLRAMVLGSGAEVIFNSEASRAAFALPEKRRAHVVYNGVTGPAAAEPTTYDAARPLRLLMLGRISRIKGQDVLLDAIMAMPESVRKRLAVRIVGSAFENKAREQALAVRIDSMRSLASISLEPFVDDPSSLYRWADVVVVPSCRPESLGRVAIEAMAFGRPPLVSAIGGLIEVVENGVTGWHVPPGDAASLASRLQDIIENPVSWRGFGAAGRARYEALFTDRANAAAFGAVVAYKLGGTPNAGAAGRRVSPSVDVP